MRQRAEKGEQCAQGQRRRAQDSGASVQARGNSSCRGYAGCVRTPNSPRGSRAVRSMRFAIDIEMAAGARSWRMGQGAVRPEAIFRDVMCVRRPVNIRRDAQRGLLLDHCVELVVWK